MSVDSDLMKMENMINNLGTMKSRRQSLSIKEKWIHRNFLTEILIKTIPLMLFYRAEYYS